MNDSSRDAPAFPWLPAAAAAAAALTVCVFLPALRNGFAWDDDLNFAANPHYRGLGWAQLRWAFTTAYLGPYQPLSWLSSGLVFYALKTVLPLRLSPHYAPAPPWALAACAAARFRQTLAVDPDSAVTHNMLGLVLARQGKLAQGAASLCRALTKPE